VLYPEFRRHLGKAGMTINDFAAYLGVRPASVSNYSKSGAVPRSYAIIAILLGDTADRSVNVRELLGGFGVFPQTVSRDSNVEQLDMFPPIQDVSTFANGRSKRPSKNRNTAGGEDITKARKGGGRP
jgi:transcriptional regulator with XRE-family HTH domain